jgi:chorismate mutase
MDFEKLMEQLLKQRPDLGEAIGLIRQVQNEKREKAEQEEALELDRVEKLTALLDKQKNINKELLHQFRKLEKNYRQLLGHMDEFAEAVGACPHCWGEEPECNYCHGRGTSGYFQPNPEYFNVYIQPLMKKINYVKQ